MSIDNGIYYRLPFLKDSNCPFCQEKINRKREAHLLLSGTRGLQTVFYSTAVPCCAKCGMPYATKLFLNQLQYETSRQPELINSMKRDFLIQEIGRVPKGEKKILDRKRKLPFQIIEKYIPERKVLTRIVCNHSYRKVCPVCGGILRKRELFIPVALAHQAVMRGAYCNECDRFFTHHSRWSIHQLLDGNPLTEWFFFDEYDPGDEMALTEQEKRDIEYRRQRRVELRAKEKAEAEAKRLQEEKTKEKKLFFENHPSTAFILIAVFPDAEREVQIVDKKTKQSYEEYIFRYDTETGREFLSAAVVPQRNGVGRIDGQTFRITDVFHSANGIYTGNRVKYGNGEFIRIEKDGGYYTSVFHDPDCILVDLLLYSPFTCRLEIMPSTYNRRKEYYFTDIRHYREFVQKYGKPDILTEFIPRRIKGGKGNLFSNLSVQSFLNAYGYTANQHDNFSAQYRQILLAEVVDLDFLTISEVCDYLDFFITTHTRDEDDLARAKWSEDLEFISSYKYNPERFLIAPE